MTEEQIQDRLIDLDGIVAAKFKGKKIPRWVMGFFKRFIHQDWMNSMLRRGYDGAEFCDDLLEQMDVKIEVEGLENVPADGTRYTFASNHPLGAVDGIALCSLITRHFGPMKMLVNDFLLRQALSPDGISLGTKSVNILLRSDSKIDFLLECFPHLFGGRVLVYAVQVMICTVMMNVITAQVAVLVYIESGVVIAGAEAVPDISAFDLPVSAVSPIPKAQVGDQKNGLGELDIQIGTLIVQIVAVCFQHHPISFIIREFRVLRLQICSPILIVEEVVAPDQMFAVSHLASPRSMCCGF